MKIIVTGGAGFIGSALVRHLIKETSFSVLNLDKLTYAGNLDSLREIADSNRYQFVEADICDSKLTAEIIDQFKPDVVLHLAAESHVDRSIDSPLEFVQTNVVGTVSLLGSCTDYWRNLPSSKKNKFRFHHVSTDEVFGSLSEGELFTENTPYDPSSPYSASKASSDHFVRAWYRTYGLPVLITNCSNNYGPYQFPEKLVPHVILSALKHERIPIYGDGSNIRDWLFVDDHVQALMFLLEKGEIGETYNVGGKCEKSNLEVVTNICSILDDLAGKTLEQPKKYDELITFVADRPGHDQRYAIDASKLESLGWRPSFNFDRGLHDTVSWYLNNESWCDRVLDGSYKLTRKGLG